MGPALDLHSHRKFVRFFSFALNLSDCVSFFAGAFLQAGGAGGGVDDVFVGRVAHAVVEAMRKREEESDKASAATPNDYE